MNESRYLDWSLTPFEVHSLVDGQSFPAFTNQHLRLRYFNGSIVKDDSGEPVLYLPFVNFSCLEYKFPNVSIDLVHVSIDGK